ncbi:MAG TPA: nickel-dependent lactate racemase [Anaerolineaceae bacterium]|uniref:Uncharacterized protein n=1 Tax=Anaerolinea thermophila TaxID=167964 RepID=A0A101FYU2_9CHLR|nr:MAG: hypothetical protein XD73_0232 [Anaerolinea thermophila]HAF61262.1 nickel-dependent lactate racemase [Anaerolineaceae bacterium]
MPDINKKLRNAIDIPYGSGSIQLDLSRFQENFDIFYPPHLEEKPLAEKDIERFLEKQVVNFKADATISIAINDNTRPARNDLLLKTLLYYLESKNIQRDRIVIWIAMGTHTPLDPARYKDIIPSEIVESYRIYAHNCDLQNNLLYLGETSHGTPVYINKMFFESDIKITIGTIEPHHFMGFSGGAKTAGIGLAGRETIEKNHTLLLQPHTETAEYSRNPMRMDLEEIGDMLKIDTCFNAIMDHHKNVIRLFWGKPRDVMVAGIEWSKKLCQISVPDLYDVVIASAGGFPKDINFYQAQKAITNACMICKKGGSIILLAECREGPGNQRFYEFMQGKRDFSEVIEKFRDIPFAIGPHKAYLLARQGLQYDLFLKSSMDDNMVRTMLMTPLPSLQEMVGNETMPNKKIALLPYAALTVPNLL